MAGNISYGAAERALSVAFQVAEPGMPKFRARLRQLQRHGIPHGSNTTKRANADYGGATQLIEIAVALELFAVGLPPGACKSCITAARDELRNALVAARHRNNDDDVVLLLFTNFDFVSLTGERKDAVGELVTDVSTVLLTAGAKAADIGEAFSSLANRRSIVLDMTRLLLNLTVGLRAAGVESAYVWSATEFWRRGLDQDENTNPSQEA